MKHLRLLRTLAVITCLAMVLAVLPIFAASAAELDWTMEADEGITNPNDFHLATGAVFQGKLMVYSTNFFGIPVALTGGATIYTYDGIEFVQVGDAGFGDANNIGLQPTAVYQGDLYVGTTNVVTGSELFTWNGRANPVLVPPSAGGWGDGAPSDTTFPQGVVDNKLVVSVSNRGGPNPGLRVYEYDGTAWTQLVGPAGTLYREGFGPLAGPGNPDNEAAGPGVMYDGKLILPVANMNTGLEIWEYDGTDFSKIGDPVGNWGANQAVGFASVDEMNSMLYLGTGDKTYFFGPPVEGGQLWSYDGTTWTKMKDGGITGTNDAFIQPYSRGKDLYIGTSNDVDGGSVYRLLGTDYMPMCEPGFGDPANNWSVFLGEFANKMLGCTLNANEGGEVWTTPMLSQMWFFAEGTTRDNATDGSYDEWLCIQNPGANEAEVEITYMFRDGSTQDQDVTVEPESRMTVDVNAAVGADKDVSTVIESDWPILVERPMYFNYRNKWPGGHIVMGVSMPRQNWFFAEGTTRDNQYDGTYEEWLCIQNPTPDDAEVEVTYMLETGDTVEKTYDVGATSRRTVDVNLDVGENHDVSVVLNSDQPIVAERPMYFNYRNKWTGGHNVVGAPGPAGTFYFAEGTTRDNPTDGAFEQWICIQNPGGAAATVDITYWTANAGTKTQTVTVPATSRQTYDVELELGKDVDTSFKIESDQPILVERPMYFNYHSAWDGGHDVMGCAGPKLSYYFAEGTTLTDFNEYLAVLNPNDEAAEVTITYMLEGEDNETSTVTIDPESRFTQNVASEIGINQNVSVLIQSNRPIVAERPMYFGYQGKWAGGHDTLGYGI